MIIVSKSEKDTVEIGKIIGSMLESGDIVALDGDLGAGKTHLTKGIAEGLGVDEYITSPTFTIVNEYMGRIPFYHFDVYRIEDINEMFEIGFDEYLFGSGACVIEWADIVKDLLPDNIIRVRIKRLTDDEREIFISDDKRFEVIKGMNI